jgi:hypothetical protein
MALTIAGERTRRFRRPLLYPLSYGGGDDAKCGAKFADTCRGIYTVVSRASGTPDKHRQVTSTRQMFGATPIKPEAPPA